VSGLPAVLPLLGVVVDAVHLPAAAAGVLVHGLAILGVAVPVAVEGPALALAVADIVPGHVATSVIEGEVMLGCQCFWQKGIW